MKFEIKGLDEFEKKLEGLSNKMKNEVEGDVKLSDLFNHQFMSAYTDFHSIDDFFKNSPFEIKSQEDFERLNVR